MFVNDNPMPLLIGRGSGMPICGNLLFDFFSALPVVAGLMKKEDLLKWPPTVLFLVLICSLMWGSAFPTLKVGFELLGITQNTGGKLYFAAYRFLLAGLLLFAGIRLSGRPIALSRKRDYAVLATVGLLQTTFQYVFFYIGLSNTTALKASIITGAGSFFLALFSHWWMTDDRMTTRKSFGLILGFLGVVLVNFQSGGFDFRFALTGEGFILLGTITSVFAILVVKKFAVRLYPPLMVAYSLTIGAVVLILIALACESPSVIQLTTQTTLIMIYLSFVSAAAFSLWYLLVKHNQLSKMAVYRFLIPVCGTFLSAAILKAESLNWLALTSLALVASGMILTSLQSNQTIRKPR